MSDESDNDLGGFEEFQGDSPDSSTDPEETNDVEQNATDDVRRGETVAVEDASSAGRSRGEGISKEVFDLQKRVETVEEQTDRLEPADAENPTGVDPIPGKWDLCFDRAKPGARVYIVDVLAASVPDYRENYPDAPELDSYEGNVLSRMREADRVLAAVYVKDTLTSVSPTAYPMPESRLTRYPAEEASLVGPSTAEFDRPPVDGKADLQDDGDVVPDGGVTGDDLREATEEFFDADDVDNIDYAPDRDSGVVVVSVEEVGAGYEDGQTFDLTEFEETLKAHGFTHTGYIPAPGMTQVNVSAEGEEDA